VSSASYRVVKLAPGFDLGAFDCGEPPYNEWLANDASRAVESGSAAVQVLVETPTEHDDQPGHGRVVGYFAIRPTLIVRDDAPKQIRRGLLCSAPGWLLAKLALDQSLRGNPERQWGRQLLREALLTIIAAADLGGGQVIVVDPDHASLVAWYAANGFLSTGGPDLRMYMKIGTARAYLQ
jgi:hypothetical protein